MGVLDQVTQMRSQGMQNNEIITKLQEQGLSPKEINDAVSQSQIKSAVTGTQPEMANPVPEEQPQYDASTQEMGIAAQPPMQQQINSPIQEAPYPQEAYDEYGDYGSYEPGMNTDAFIEVAGQVFSEKIKKIQKQVDELVEFKSLAQINIGHNSERIKRIESTMDKLQMAILDKIGSYGKTLEGIKKEMTMMQDSFGKMVKPLASRAAAHHAHPKTAAKHIAKTTKKRTITARRKK